MPVCALCENQQAVGDSCEVCGRPFPRGERAAPPVPTLAELQPTRQAPAGTVPLERLADLEPTAAGGGAARTVLEGVPGFEPTRAAPVGAVAVESLDLERHAAEPLTEAGEPPARACRYCRTPASGAELLCARCGMKLPEARPVRAEQAGASRPCSECGIPTSGPQCRACGARLAE